MIQRKTRTVCMLARLAAVVIISASATQAITVEKSTSIGRGLGFVYDPAQEVTVVGTVRGFAPSTSAARPAGVHLLISASGKVVDAHLGPYLSKETQQALHSGQLVRIIGVNEKVGGKSILLARRIVFSGRQVTIRTERGFLVRSDFPHRKPAGNGGAQ
jgi:hypothetical protein